ncbi:hypothetical protein TTHERM_00091630 (macronuclear) [Tetrahymena thermophila SB210]|uniref:Uncharacterized protein n=1 Tax=Tetrahymena thermophila (strain SB210) TaxID=312017 RepID=Q236D0_TETTS|nr:hypothetical protein TTHERM_00091630 [Tetrahymena thermophila SB210]EAR92570.2 hypothetical protein TTHERM_00091630 [Tetrahymena thermophila SB210]|eukprot:XP_001012815.2 hypothetical protein TTHERM_00091630 [Tetrahymena thermophila SB210]
MANQNNSEGDFNIIKSIQFEIEQKTFYQQVCSLLKSLKYKIELKINKKIQDNQTIIVKIKGQTLQYTQNAKDDIQNLQMDQQQLSEINNLIEEKKLIVQSIKLNLTDNFLEKNQFLQLGQEISQLCIIDKIIFQNKKKLSFNDKTVENIKQFFKVFNNVDQIEVNINKECNLVFLELIAFLTQIKDHQNLKIEGVNYTFNRNQDNSIDLLQLNKFHFSNSQNLDKIKPLLKKVKKLVINLEGFFNSINLSKTIESINNLKDLEELYFNYEQNGNIQDKFTKNMKQFEIGAKNLKVLDTQLPFDFLQNTLEKSKNLTVFKMTSLINDQKDILYLKEFIQKMQKIQNITLGFEFLNFDKLHQLLQGFENQFDSKVQFKIIFKDYIYLEYKQKSLDSLEKNELKENIIEVDVQNDQSLIKTDAEQLIKIISSILKQFKLTQNNEQLQNSLGNYKIYSLDIKLKLKNKFLLHGVQENINYLFDQKENVQISQKIDIKDFIIFEFKKDSFAFKRDAEEIQYAFDLNIQNYFSLLEFKQEKLFFYEYEEEQDLQKDLELEIQNDCLLTQTNLCKLQTIIKEIINLNGLSITFHWDFIKKKEENV